MVLNSDTAVFKDTGHFAIFIDDHEVGEVPGDALRNDLLQGQTSSVVHMSIWDYCGQLLTKLHRPLQDTYHKVSNVLNRRRLKTGTDKAVYPAGSNLAKHTVQQMPQRNMNQPLTPLGLSDVVMSTLGFVSPLK